MQRRWSCFAGVALILNGTALGVVSASGRETVQRPCAFVEWTLGDLVQNRLRLHSEYLIADGLAVGVSSEGLLERHNDWKHSQVAAGASLTQYFGGSYLLGRFVRGEMLVFHSRFRGETQAEERVDGHTFGMALDLDAGIRHAFSHGLTTTFGLGVRRLVPDFFEQPKPGGPGGVLAERERLWQARFDAGIGIAF